MLWLKLLVPVVALAMGILELKLENRWRDRRTKAHRLILSSIYVVLVVSFILTLFIVYDEHKTNLILSGDLERLSLKSDSLRQQSDLLILQSDTLKNEIRLVSSRLSPFIDLARLRYGNLPPDTALRRLAVEISSIKKVTSVLQRDTQRLKRGSLSFYEYDGSQRVVEGGRQVLNITDETIVFREMLLLESDQKWHELIGVSERQIARTPEWLTPYMFAGVGHAQIGNMAKAIEYFAFVDSVAGGDSRYENASVYLKQLRGY